MDVNNIKDTEMKKRYPVIEECASIPTKEQIRRELGWDWFRKIEEQKSIKECK
jgi:hypothetical protein